jgi:hypothetical protein
MPIVQQIISNIPQTQTVSKVEKKEDSQVEEDDFCNKMILGSVLGSSLENDLGSSVGSSLENDLGSSLENDIQSESSESDEKVAIIVKSEKSKKKKKNKK